MGKRSFSKKKKSVNRAMPMSQAMPKILDDQSSFRDSPDDIFDQILLKAFPKEEKLTHLLNGKDKIEFIHCYTDLMAHLSYLKLLQDQWNYYYQTGMTQHIWTNRVPKYVAEKNSMVHVHGRSKRMIEQRLSQIQPKLEHLTERSLSV